MRQLRHHLAALSSIWAGLTVPLHAGAAPAFAPTHTIPLDGEGHWDYASFDGSHQRLYITHGNQVQVIGPATHTQIGAILHTDGVHGVDFAPELNLGFTSNGRSDSVTVFTLDTLAVQRQLKVSGKNPDALLYLSQVHQLYTFNGSSHDVTVFEVPSMRIVATVPVGGRPESAVHDGAGRVYVNLEDQNVIGVIDVATRKLVARWPLGHCEEPTGLALDRLHARLFSACKNQLAVVTDARDGHQVADFPIGSHPDVAAYDAGTGLVLVANGDSATLTVVRQQSPDRYTVEAQVATVAGAKTMAYDPLARQVYLPALIDGRLQVMVLAPATK